MRRFNNNSKAVWGSSRSDNFQQGHSRRQYPEGRQDFGGFNRPPFDDTELEIRPSDETRQGESVGNKLDRLLDRFAKLEVWREETDRRFGYIGSALSREIELPSAYEDGGDGDGDSFCRRRTGDWGIRSRRQFSSFRDSPSWERGRREGGNRYGREGRDRYSGRDETDRRFDNLEPALSHEIEPPLRYEDGEEFNDDDFRQQKPWERGYRSRDLNGNFRGGSSMERGRREGRGRMSNSGDPPGSRVEVFRSRSWPNPESPVVSHHLDPPNRLPRQRYQPIGYRDRTQEAWPRHCGDYTEIGGHLSDRRDQQTQLRFDRHPTHATQRPRPTCWDRPHPQDEMRALQAHSASYWDPSGLHTQQGYPVDDASFEIFGGDDLCWGGKSSLSHNRYIECSMPSPVKDDVLGEYKADDAMTTDISHIYAENEDELEDYDEWDVVAEDVPNNITDVSINTAIGGGKRCDYLESVLSIDSSLETALDAFVHDASGDSSPSPIALLCDNRGVEEDRDASLGTRQVPSFKEIYPLCGSDAFLPLIERDFKVLFQGNVHDRLDIWKLRKMMNSSLLKEDRNGFYVDLHISTVASMNFRSALLDADARLIPPRMDTRCLSIRARVDKILVSALNYHEAALVIFDGDNEGRCSIVWCAFDPGGDILVAVHKVVFEMKKQELEVGRQEKRQLYADELRVQTGGLVVKESPIGNTMEIVKKRAQPGEVKVPSSEVHGGECEEFFIVEESERLSYNWVIIGRAGSISVRTAMLRDSKQWRLLAPDVMQHKIHMSSKGVVADCSFSKIKWFMHFYNATKNWETTGVVVWVPNDWWHLVAYLEDYVTITKYSGSTENGLHVFNLLTWLVAEHLWKSFEQQWLSLTFSTAIFRGNSLVAMETGFLRHMWIDLGHVSTLSVTAIFLSSGVVVVLSSWIEVYGNPSESKDLLIQIKSYWGTKQQFCVFDPGGDALHSFFYQRSSWLLVPTLRTRWISTVGELIRFHILGYHN